MSDLVKTLREQVALTNEEYAEHDYRTKAADLIEQQQREIEEAKAEIGSLCGELGDLNHLMQQIEKERDALAAHVERLKSKAKAKPVDWRAWDIWFMTLLTNHPKPA